MSMLGADNLRRVIGDDFHRPRKKYEVPGMWGNIHPQWRLLKNQLQTKGPGWYPVSEREERLFTNRSNRPGDDILVSQACLLTCTPKYEKKNKPSLLHSPTINKMCLRGGEKRESRLKMAAWLRSHRSMDLHATTCYLVMACDGGSNFVVKLLRPIVLACGCHQLARHTFVHCSQSAWISHWSSTSALEV